MEVESQSNKVQIAVIALPENEANPAAVTKQETRKSTVSQFAACASVQSLQLMMGIGMGFSSALIPQVEADGSDLRLTRDQCAWIASIFTIAAPFGSLLGGWVMNAAGRLRACQLMTIPLAASWALIAIAQSFEELLAGRFISGACLGMSFSASMLYTAEVAEKDIRGVLSCMGTAYASLGVVITYAVGAYVPWRAGAWGFAAVPLVLLVVLVTVGSESPVWLRQKDKLAEARRVSTRFYNNPEKVLSSPKEAQQKEEISVWQTLGLLFTKPTGIKPFIMMNTLFIGQQLAGVYITIFYAVTFFQESGSEVDPYITTILIGVLRLVFSCIIALTASSLGRRPALLVSTIGMGVCMVGSGLVTQEILRNIAEGGVPETWLSWAVVALILLFIVFSSSGLTILPWSMMAEVFPHEMRSVAQPINSAACSFYVFLGVQLYPTIATWLGGSAGVQFLFAGASFFMAAFVWAFVVETRGLALEEIEEYFSKNFFYPGHKSRMKKGPVPSGA